MPCQIIIFGTDLRTPIFYKAGNVGNQQGAGSEN
jgi:hypothetical protein